jgi:hypothetical protein
MKVMQNSFNTIAELQSMHILENALLFSVDAISMYKNIDTPIGVSAVRDFIKSNCDKISNDSQTVYF